LEKRGRLSSEIAWDSHNSLVMAIDDEGFIHLCGNMHVDPLIYFRTSRPLDVTSFERVDFMVGQEEDRCTYPVFMRGPNDELIFRYRDGSSGKGIWKLDPETLQIVGTYPPPASEIPDELEQVTSGYEGMMPRTMWARGTGSKPGERYLLRWETLGPNRDRPREEAPPPSELWLHTVKAMSD
jgi:hypothetical protein